MTVLTRTKPCSGAKNAEAQRGFTMPDLVVVLSTMGVLFGPILAAFDNSMETTHDEFTQISLDTARTALIKFAAANNGCLPFAADFEGGVPDTNDSGEFTPGLADTGVGTRGKHGGDVPWADLGLGKHFVDGVGLRIQYYVASQYTDDDEVANNELTCKAGVRGVEWNPSVTYNGSNPQPIYVYYTRSGSDRRLYKITGTLPAGTPPDTVVGDITEDLTVPLPASLLEVRRGPDVTSVGSNSDVVSTQNVFVLNAPGENRNVKANDRSHIRDANHVNPTEFNEEWNIDLDVVDNVIFAAVHNTDPTDQGNDGDDTLMVVSFISFKAALNKYGLHVEPVCEEAC